MTTGEWISIGGIATTIGGTLFGALLAMWKDLRREVQKTREQFLEESAQLNTKSDEHSRRLDGHDQQIAKLHEGLTEVKVKVAHTQH